MVNEVKDLVNDVGGIEELEKRVRPPFIKFVRLIIFEQSHREKLNKFYKIMEDYEMSKPNKGDI